MVALLEIVFGVDDGHTANRPASRAHHPGERQMGVDEINALVP